MFTDCNEWILPQAEAKIFPLLGQTLTVDHFLEQLEE
jgi:hypothetical protein